MEFGKRYDTTDNGLCPHQHVADLLWGSGQLLTDMLLGNWCNGVWP